MPADTIIHNAKVATNATPSFVEAVAISNGKIIATGTSDEILRQQKSSATKLIDANGRTVIPGLVNKLSCWSVRLVPRRFASWMSRRVLGTPKLALPPRSI